MVNSIQEVNENMKYFSNKVAFGICLSNYGGGLDPTDMKLARQAE